ncbi:MAG: hypothetical protein SOX72_06410 [Oscillospiraceae bacterium]|nr:hypothetical protein [Oscillospiraceae bacterium]
MSIIVSNISIGLDEPFEKAAELGMARLGLRASDILESYPVKVSVDARRKERIRLVYAVGYELHCGEERVREAPGVSKQSPAGLSPVLGKEPIPARPVIAGFGPAGMFAALVLSQYGYRPLVLERGASVEKRVGAVEGFWRGGALDPRTNVQFGEGGAGTFSDGKLTTRIHDPRCGYVMEQMVRFGLPKEAARRAKPHIGTDRLRELVRSLREEVVRRGGEVRFLTQMTDFKADASGRGWVEAEGERLPAPALILAVGHSARDTFRLVMEKGAAVQPKPFSVGVRVEHLQSDIDRGLFGECAGHPALGRGEYQLSHREGERGVYTFCMCPGGVVVPAASEEGGLVTNGMSEYARDGKNANSALVVSVGPEDYGSSPWDGVAFQMELERRAFRMGGGAFCAPAQTAGLFLEGKPGLTLGRVEPSYALGTSPCNLEELFPPQVTRMLREGLRRFGRKLPGFAAADTVLTGAETRTSSPLRILRGDTLEAVGLPGLYPCGEGAGYAGGIVSAAVDGVRAAEAVMARWAPPKD